MERTLGELSSFFESKIEQINRWLSSIESMIVQNSDIHLEEDLHQLDFNFLKKPAPAVNLNPQDMLEKLGMGEAHALVPTFCAALEILRKYRNLSIFFLKI